MVLDGPKRRFRHSDGHRASAARRRLTMVASEHRKHANMGLSASTGEPLAYAIAREMSPLASLGPPRAMEPAVGHIEELSAYV